jgi:hypothetical protein
VLEVCNDICSFAIVQTLAENVPSADFTIYNILCIRNI